jgi:predicted enzyme related to lactoylglutathione lyase
MTINEFRVAITTEEFDRVVFFYRDGLGLDPGDLWSEGGGRGQLFFAGRASPEVFDPKYAAHVDSIEVGKRVSGQIRFAFEVPDLNEAVTRALNFGATLVHELMITPWGDLNARVQSPDGLQVTLFQVDNNQEQNLM